MRGGGQGPNYDSVSVTQAQEELKKAKLAENIVIDCSHGNSHKNHKLQSAVLHDIIRQKCDGNLSIKGFMIESNLFEGNQKLTLENKDKLQHGVSITDACLGWDETQRILIESAKTLRNPK